MKIECLDHVVIAVKDMDRAVEFMSKLFELEFQEVAPEMLPGFRICISQPDGKIELVSLLDAREAAQANPRMNETVDLMSRGYEGLMTIFLKVDDAAATSGEAEKLGACVASSVHMDAGQLMPFLPKFTEVLFDDRAMPVKGLALIDRK